MTDAYRRAGVDIEAAAKAVTLIGDLAARTRRPEVADEVGGFAGLFRIGDGKLLAAATDGVGTKLEIARATGRLDTVGIDLVAMCADDVVCTGAEPLFFLDYLAVGNGRARASGVDRGGRGRRVPAGRMRAARRGDGRASRHDARRPVRPRGVLRRIGRRGIAARPVARARGRRAGRARLERAARQRLLPRAPRRARPACARRDRRRSSAVGRSPTSCSSRARSTRRQVLALAREGLVHAAAHITGGGLLRERAAGAARGTRRGGRAGRAGPSSRCSRLVQASAGASDDDMFATFNMGVGMVLVVAPDDAERVLDRAGETAVPHRAGRRRRRRSPRLTCGPATYAELRGSLLTRRISPAATVVRRKTPPSGLRKHARAADKAGGPSDRNLQHDA